MQRRDTSVVLGVVVVVAVLTLVVNVVTDLVYSVIDPKTREATSRPRPAGASASAW